MSSVTPGDPGYADALERVARIIREDEKARGDIQRMSEQSFRAWLDQIVDQVAQAMGWAAGAALAMVKDYLAIASNAGHALVEGYRRGVDEARHVRRRKQAQ